MSYKEIVIKYLIHIWMYKKWIRILRFFIYSCVGRIRVEIETKQFYSVVGGGVDYYYLRQTGYINCFNLKFVTDHTKEGSHDVYFSNSKQVDESLVRIII